MQGAWGGALPWHRFTQRILKYTHHQKLYIFYKPNDGCAAWVASLYGALEIARLRRKTIGTYWINSHIEVSRTHSGQGENLSNTDFTKICHLFWVKLARFLVETGSGFRENLPPTFGKSVVRKSATEFEEIRHRFWGNLSPTLGKWATDFRKIGHWLWGIPSPTLGKSVTDSGKMSHRLWGNEPPTWENEPRTLGKWATHFAKMSHRFWGNQRPTSRKSATDFGEMSHRLWENELRRRREIRNKLFQEISLNKIT